MTTTTTGYVGSMKKASGKKVVGFDLCQIRSCDGERYSLGLCRAHYARYKRGVPLGEMTAVRPPPLMGAIQVGTRIAPKTLAKLKKHVAADPEKQLTVFLLMRRILDEWEPPEEPN